MLTRGTDAPRTRFAATSVLKGRFGSQESLGGFYVADGGGLGQPEHGGRCSGSGPWARASSSWRWMRRRSRVAVWPRRNALTPEPADRAGRDRRPAVDENVAGWPCSARTGRRRRQLSPGRAAGGGEGVQDRLVDRAGRRGEVADAGAGHADRKPRRVHVRVGRLAALSEMDDAGRPCSAARTATRSARPADTPASAAHPVPLDYSVRALSCGLSPRAGNAPGDIAAGGAPWRLRRAVLRWSIGRQADPVMCGESDRTGEFGTR